MGRGEGEKAQTKERAVTPLPVSNIPRRLFSAKNILERRAMCEMSFLPLRRPLRNIRSVELLEIILAAPLAAIDMRFFRCAAITAPK